MHPVYPTTNLPSSSDAQENIGQEHAESIVQEPKVINATILEHITEAFIALDRQWRITYCNAKAVTLTQRAREELLGKNLWETFPEIVKSTFYHRCQKAATTGNAEQFETRSLRFQKWIRIHIFPSHDDITIFLNDITAQKQVQEQEHFQANILRHIRDSVIVTDLQGKITYWNEGAGCIFGYTPDEMIGHTIARLYPDYDVTHLDHTAAKLAQDLQPIADGEDNSSEWQGRCKDGTLIWVDVKTSMLHSTDGTVCGYIGVAKDITGRKLVEEQVQHSEKRFRALIENSADAIALMTADGLFLYASSSTARVLGYQPEELVGRHAFREHIYPADLALTRRVFTELLQESGKSTLTEYRLRHKDGSWRWFEGSALNLLDDPQVGAIVVNYRDITEHKRLDEELQRSKDQLEVILRNVDDGIIVQNATGTIVYANHQIATRAGYSSAEEMLATPPAAYWERVELTDEQGHPFLLSQLPGRRALQGEANPQVSIRYVNKQTHEVGWSLIKSTAVFERNHTASLVISVLQDITQFKELERRKDEFIMHVSHELRTPLTALIGFLELINEYSAKLDEPTKARFFYRALENCQELTRLVNAVLDVLQVNHSAKPAQPTHLSLAPLVHEIIAQLDPRKAQEYLFQVNIPEPLTAWADEQYLRHVLRNLLSNACKYAPKQTSVLISATPDESLERETPSMPQVCISVQDAGPGIPPAEQPLLFEKFTRLKRDLASTVRGTGLGLYICKQLVDKMGGHIWVESSGRPGEGSCFRFTLPATSKTAPSAASDQSLLAHP